ncbi:hypothetical protein CIL03_08810 [Virgibacillus indicus]|uniref:Uncharacterized protein n=1 Tax=Virgibacillus indicus TaxID=2024554 RepID=A0A265NAP0_9BACI|nr:hypothetical protein [Virgibacillus indicus]OZU89102.1 hypothetical protein CIL03_08810 [Virgibacillus indicus]
MTIVNEKSMNFNKLVKVNFNGGDDIGLEVYPHTDKILRIKQGQGLAQMGVASGKCLTLYIRIFLTLPLYTLS